IVPNTMCPTLLRFGETAQVRVYRNDGSSIVRSIAELHRAGQRGAQALEVLLPSAVLRRMEILDLPGFRSLEEAAGNFQWGAGADIYLWCTLATQAWKASEQAIWKSLALPKEFSCLVLTHRDLLSKDQLGDVTGRIEQESHRYFRYWTAVSTPAA